MKHPAELRDEAIAEAADHFSRLEVDEAVAALMQLRWATIDADTLARTDSYLGQIVAGRRVVATTEPSRRPAPDEVVVIYGNYPHLFDNVVVNNPIKRHVSMFGALRHDVVEFDSRWNGVDRIFVINADDRPDRYDGVLRELAVARAPLDRITRISARRPRTTGSARVDGQIGCVSSHLDALRTAREAGHSNTLVLEDDFSFTSDLESHLDDLEAFHRRRYDYLVCLLATSKYGVIEPMDDLVSKSLQPCTNTGGYLVSRQGIERLIPLWEDALRNLEATKDVEKYAIDISWSVLQSSGKFLVFRRKLGFQAASMSDIEGRIARYLD